MKIIKRGTPVWYTEAKAIRGPWRVEHHYGNGVYRIGSKTEFCDMVPVAMLRVIKARVR